MYMSFGEWYKMGKVKWRQVRTWSNRPQPRFFHCMCTHRDENAKLHIYIFGGRDSTYSNHFNDVYHICCDQLEASASLVCTKLYPPEETAAESNEDDFSDSDDYEMDGNVEDSTWTGIYSDQTTLDDQVPEPRRSASMVYCPQRYSLLIYGGRDHVQLYGKENEVFEFDIANRSWKRHAFPNDPNGPGTLRNHSAVLRNQNQNMIIFGGYNVLNGVNPTCNMFQYNIESRIWTKIMVENKFTIGQHIACMRDNNRMVVFGGKYDQSDESNNDLIWEYHFDENLWYKIKFEGRSPSGRYAHSGCILGDELFIIGGYDSYMSLQDFWSANLVTKRWTEYPYKYYRPIFGHTLNIMTQILSDINYFKLTDPSFLKQLSKINLIAFAGSTDTYHSQNSLLHIKLKLALKSIESSIKQQIENLPARKTFLTDMHNMFSKQSAVSIGDVFVNSIQCHSYMLCRCNFFKKQFGLANPKNIYVNVDCDILRIFIKYVYSGSLPLEEVDGVIDYKLLVKLANVATNYFEMGDLVEACIEYFERHFLKAKYLNEISEYLKSFIPNGKDRFHIHKVMCLKLMSFAYTYDLIEDPLNDEIMDLNYQTLPKSVPVASHMLELLRTASMRMQLNSNKEQFIEVLVQGNENQIPTILVADKAVLVHRSAYVSCLYNCNFEDSRRNELDFFSSPDNRITEQVMLFILRWIYCGEVNLLISILEEQYEPSARQKIVEEIIIKSNMLLLDELAELFIQYEEFCNSANSIL